jgi:curved DNA-binding protein
MPATKDYYHILGITRTDSDEVIKKAYRKLAMEYHPDRNPGKEKWANEKFKEINEAYAVLGDANKKKQYDQFGTTGNAADIVTSRTTRSTFEDMLREFSKAGLGDLVKNRGSAPGSKTAPNRTGGPTRHSQANLDEFLKQILNQKQSTQRPATQHPLTAHQAAAHHRDIQYEITISSAEAYHGVTKFLERSGKRLQVEIPAGVKSGKVIRLANARQLTDGHPGDILVRVTTNT